MTNVRNNNIPKSGGVFLHYLGERLNGIQEVSGSIPLISTKYNRQDLASCLLYFYESGIETNSKREARNGPKVWEEAPVGLPSVRRDPAYLHQGSLENKPFSGLLLFVPRENGLFF